MKWIRPGDGAVGRAYAEGRLVVIEDYSNAPDRLAVLGDEGLEAAMSAPVEENARVIGALTVATHRQRTDVQRDRAADACLHRRARKRRADECTNSADLMEHLAFHDPLTGLPNRALFADRVTAHSHAAVGRHR